MRVTLADGGFSRLGRRAVVALVGALLLAWTVVLPSSAGSSRPHAGSWTFVVPASGSVKGPGGVSLTYSSPFVLSGGLQVSSGGTSLTDLRLIPSPTCHGPAPITVAGPVTIHPAPAGSGDSGYVGSGDSGGTVSPVNVASLQGTKKSSDPLYLLFQTPTSATGDLTANGCLMQLTFKAG